MKKTAALLILIFAGFESFGQASAGIKIGGNLYGIKGAGKSERLFGYEAGFFSKAEIGKSISLMLEVDYLVKKSKVTIDDSSSTLEMNFVSFRISCTYDFTENFFIGAGPYFSYMINPVQKPGLIKKSYFTHFAVGLNPYIGLESGRFALIMKYDLGLTVLTLEDTPEASGNLLTGAKFNGANLVIGVKF